jgi:hypothetical protein
VLAAALVAVRLGPDPEGILAVAALGAGGTLAYWLVFYVLVLDEHERAVLRRRG